MTTLFDTQRLQLRELEESVAWQKLDWEEREDLLMRFSKRPDIDDHPSY